VFDTKETFMARKMAKQLSRRRAVTLIGAGMGMLAAPACGKETKKPPTAGSGSAGPVSSLCASNTFDVVIKEVDAEPAVTVNACCTSALHILEAGAKDPSLAEHDYASKMVTAIDQKFSEAARPPKQNCVIVFNLSEEHASFLQQNVNRLLLTAAKE
jgi:hypothetical protein